jgi:hypothetical protein
VNKVDAERDRVTQAWVEEKGIRYAGPATHHTGEWRVEGDNSGWTRVEGQT